MTYLYQMLKRVLFLLSFIPFWNVLQGQVVYQGIVPSSPKPEVFRPYLSIGAAPAYCVINNRMEMRGDYKSGIHAELGWHTKPWFYWSAEYTHFMNHASFGLENITSWNAEANANFLFGMGQSDLLFKMSFGAGFLNWNGIFAGPSLNDNLHYYIGMPLHQEMVFGTCSFGLARNIGKYFTATGDFRMRFASEKQDLLSISDTGFFLGLMWNIHGGGHAADTDPEMKKKTNSGKRGRIYKWMRNR